MLGTQLLVEPAEQASVGAQEAPPDVETRISRHELTVLGDVGHGAMIHEW